MAPVPGDSRIAGEEMTLLDWIGLALCVGLMTYLFIALLLPEKFE
jgi:K+-transporting ATPase KdpF subunit